MQRFRGYGVAGVKCRVFSVGWVRVVSRVWCCSGQVPRVFRGVGESSLAGRVFGSVMGVVGGLHRYSSLAGIVFASIPGVFRGVYRYSSLTGIVFASIPGVFCGVCRVVWRVQYLRKYRVCFVGYVLVE